MPSAVEFRVLGPLETRIDGAPAHVEAPKIRVLLAMLLAHACRPVPLGRLIEEMWPDQAPASAVANIRTYAAQLRRLLPAGRLATARSGYRLVVEQHELDLHRFTRFSVQARAALAAGELVVAADLLGRAHDEWRGEPYGDVPVGSTLGAERVALGEARVSAAELYFWTKLALGDHVSVMPLIRKHAAAHPLREPAQELLMVALYASGDAATALTTFVATRAALVRELGIEPGERLQRMQAAILRGEPPLAAHRLPIRVGPPRAVDSGVPPRPARVYWNRSRRWSDGNWYGRGEQRRGGRP